MCLTVPQVWCGSPSAEAGIPNNQARVQLISARNSLKTPKSPHLNPSVFASSPGSPPFLSPLTIPELRQKKRRARRPAGTEDEVERVR